MVEQREMGSVQIFKSEDKPMPKIWQEKGFTDGKVSTEVTMEEGKYSVHVNAESSQDNGSDNEPSELLGMLPTAVSFETEAEAKQCAKDMIADSENWNDEKYN